MPSRKAILWILVAVALVGASLAAVFITLIPRPTTIEVARYADTYISSTSPTRAHGLEPLLWLSRVSTGEENWTLITFDTEGRLRPGDLVLSAAVHLRVAVNGSGTWPATVKGVLVTAAWTEQNATWENAPAMALDDNVTTALHEAPRFFDDVAVDVTGEFTQWLDSGRLPNFSAGLAFGSAVENASVAFASQENGTLPGPVLTVTFQTAPPGLYGYALGAVAATTAREPD